jgi:hypothetical protein
LVFEEVGHPELSAPFLAVGIDVDPDDPVGADQLRALDTLRPIPPKPKTTTLAPGSTLAVLITAPTPVVTPQPM